MSWQDLARIPLDLPTEFPDRPADVTYTDRMSPGPLLPSDHYSKSPFVNAALSSVFGPLPWLRDPDDPNKRFQLWPERMVRSALTLPGDVMSGRVPIYDPNTGQVNPEVIERVQDMSSLVMGGTAFGAPRGSMGAGPVMPERRAPTFFTGIDRALLETRQGAKVPESATMAEWTQYLAPRVKPDEVKWLLRPESADPNMRFTKQEIAERIQDNKPQEHWKGDVDEEQLMETQMERSGEIQNRWETEALPTFRKERVAAGYYNVVDQYGNILQRHVASTRVDAVIRENQHIIDGYRRRETAATPEARQRVEEEFQQMAIDAAQNHRPREAAVYDSDNYPEYQVPGGTNYQEVVFTHPSPQYKPDMIRRFDELRGSIQANESEVAALTNLWKQTTEMLKTASPEFRTRLLTREANLQAQREQVTERTQKMRDELSQIEPEYKAAVSARDQLYTSSHWDEKNALAHARMTDRNIPNYGRTLNLEEVQSDWHQKGQTEGYIGDPRLTTWDQVKSAQDLQHEIGQTLEGMVQRAQPGLSRGQVSSMVTDFLMSLRREERLRDPFFTPEEHALARQWLQAGDEVARIRERYNEQDPVPDAPFKNTWPDMMLKRMLRKAIDDGYDSISWVPGMEHAERYGQTIATGKVIWDKADGSVWNGTGGTNVKIAQGIKSEADLNRLLGDIKVKSRGVSMDDREMLVQFEEPQVLLTAKGRRMESFYDKQLVDKMNAIVGKYGAKVEKTKFETPDGIDQDVFIVKINDKMRKGIQERGFNLFSGLVPVVGNPFDFDWNKSKGAEVTNRTMQRNDWRPPEWMSNFLKQSPQSSSAPGVNLR